MIDLPLIDVLTKVSRINTNLVKAFGNFHGNRGCKMNICNQRYIVPVNLKELEAKLEADLMVSNRKYVTASSDIDSNRPRPGTAIDVILRNLQRKTFSTTREPSWRYKGSTLSAQECS
jgi:hypothetical protein